MENAAYTTFISSIRLDLISKKKGAVKTNTENKEQNIKTLDQKTGNATADRLKELGDMRSCKMGSFFFRQGEKGESMFVILKGKVEIWVEAEGISTKVITLTDGDFFGEMSLLENMPRSASALCVENSLVLEIKEDHFKQFIQMNPEITYNILKSLSRRIRRMNEGLHP